MRTARALSRNLRARLRDSGVVNVTVTADLCKPAVFSYGGLGRMEDRKPLRWNSAKMACPASTASNGSAKIDVAMNYRDHIQRDPRIVGGEPILKGTRVTLRTVLASLAEGATTAEILADFPTLCDEDVRAAIAFAATPAQEDLPVFEPPIR